MESIPAEHLPTQIHLAPLLYDLLPLIPQSTATPAKAGTDPLFHMSSFSWVL